MPQSSGLRKGWHLELEIRWFKLSTDPLFADKVRGIVWLYLDRLLKAVVLYVGDKIQMQVLDGMQAMLPLSSGSPGWRTRKHMREAVERARERIWHCRVTGRA